MRVISLCGAIALFGMLILLAGCGGGGGTGGGNAAPVISSLTAVPTLLAASADTTVTCTATDANSDPLSYAWSSSGGTVTGSGTSITWTAPGTLGDYTVTCQVNDGINGPVSRTIHLTVTDVLGHSITDITTRWNALKPTFSGTPYLTIPATTAPYVAGSVKSGFIADGINMANFMRYLAGVPDDLTQDDTRLDDAQHGAVLLCAHGSLNHTPPKPADMDQTFYDLGYGNTSSSNIAYNFDTMSGTVKAYMNDSDASNMDHLGHRRWILNPEMTKTVFGYASPMSTMYAFDMSRDPDFDYNFTAWPAPGNFPEQILTYNYMWSITLNPSIYTRTGAAETVTITRLNDNASWTLDASDTNVNGEYFRVDTNGYGVPYCLIFRPSPNMTYTAGQRYQVTVTGLRKHGDIPASLVWEMDLFTLTGGDELGDWRVMRNGRLPQIL